MKSLNEYSFFFLFTLLGATVLFADPSGIALSVAKDPGDVRTSLDSSKGGFYEGRTYVGTIRKSGPISIERVVNRDADGAPLHIHFAGRGVVEVETPKRKTRDGDDGVTYYTLRVRMSLGSTEDSVSTINLGGAVFGFRYGSGEFGGGRTAELVVLDQKKRKSGKVDYGDWIGTGYYIPVRENGQLKMATDLIVSLDSKGKTWDLYKDTTLLVSGLS